MSQRQSASRGSSTREYGGLAAIVALQMLCVAGVVASGLVAFGWARRRLHRWCLGAAVLVTGAVAGVFVLTADPINHLNNRWSGRLGV